MTIEDIDYLYENSEKENFLLIADSATRNRDFFPFPNEYTITFEQPFKNVFGIDVLDASIPSTMYNIEDGENGVCGFTYTLNPDVTAPDLQTMLYELQNFDEFDMSLNKTDILDHMTLGSDNRITGISMITTFDKVEEYLNGNQLPHEDLSGCFLYRRRVYNNAPIFEKSKHIKFTHPEQMFTFNGAEYVIENDPDDVNKQQIITALNDERCRLVVKKNANKTFTLICYAIDEVPLLFLADLRGYNNTINFILTVNFFFTEFIPGNYGVTDFLNEAKRAFGGTNIVANTAASTDIKIQPKMSFTAAIGFVFNGEKLSAKTSMGFDEHAMPNEKKAYTKLYFRDNKRLYAAVFNSKSETYTLIAPGVIYLLGTRYCLLRCKEIEDHLYGSRAYGQYSPGVAMFKMYAVNDIAHQRFDFVNFHKKPFHPIGKLDRLSFKFERADGTIYDFKGANHLLIINIKYLVPSQKRKFDRSILNPNYRYDVNPSLMRQIEFKETSDAEEEDGEDDDVRTKQYAITFNKNEREYDYSSEDDVVDIENVSKSSDNFSSDDSEINYDFVGHERRSNH